MDNDLGYLKDYGPWIMSGILIVYGILCTILCKDYEATDE